jgi:hypothetical protein
MKTKIAITVAVCALFVAVPSATLKGAKPAGLKFSVSCGANDACTLTGSGFAPGSYAMDVTDSCGLQVVTNSSVNADSAGNINTVVSPGEPSCPGNTGWTFTLFTLGKRGGSQVATFTATDTGIAP